MDQLATSNNPIHLKDDLYKLRAISLKTSRGNQQLLADALHALSRGKAHVVKDHLERVQDAISNLIQILEEVL